MTRHVKITVTRPPGRDWRGVIRSLDGYELARVDGLPTATEADYAAKAKAAALDLHVREEAEE